MPRLTARGRLGGRVAIVTTRREIFAVEIAERWAR